MKKIYITGCAKSGTTMLANLMTAFDVQVFPGEAFLTSFFTSKYDVCKRHKDFLFSEDLPYLTLWSCYAYVQQWGVRILNINRKKDDVLKSEGGYVSEKRYDACQSQKGWFGDVITMDVTFEEIIDDPVGMQASMQIYFPDLVPIASWEDYPDFVPQEHWDVVKDQGPRYGPRKLGEKK